MKRSICEAWQADLRANADKQGKGALTRNGLDCCLGRLCKLAIKAGVEIKASAMSESTTSYDGAIAILPRSVIQWSRLKDTYVPSIGKTLVQLNDSGTTFPEIADLLPELITSDD